MCGQKNIGKQYKITQLSITRHVFIDAFWLRVTKETVKTLFDTRETCAYSVLQKYGLKVYLRDPNSFTPMLEEPDPSTGVPRSLLIGSDHKLTHQQISKFSKKDADVS